MLFSCHWIIGIIPPLLVVHPPLSWNCSPFLLKRFRSIATKPTLVLPWSQLAIEPLWPSVSSLSWSCTLGRPLGSRIKVSVCSAGGLGEHRSDSEALIRGEGTLSQTLSARVPLEWGILPSLCGQGRGISSHRPHLSRIHSSLLHIIASIVWFSPLYLVNQLQLMLMSGSVL